MVGAGSIPARGALTMILAVLRSSELMNSQFRLYFLLEKSTNLM